LLGWVSLNSLSHAETPVVDKLNKKIENVTFTTLEGKQLPLGEIKEKKAVVVAFLSFDCPVSNSYVPLLNEMHTELSSKGVEFLAVCTSDESAAELQKKVAAFKIPYPICQDVKLTVVDAFKATTTPEVFVLDHNHVLRYRGRIDDGFSARLKRNPKVSEFDLKNALEDLLAGKPVRTPATTAIGCPVTVKADTTKAATTKLTYHKEVLPILQKHCQQCHRPGEVGPFSLMTYKQAVNWAEDIKEYTHSKKMPPWKPQGGPSYEGERKLTDAEIKLLAEWVDGGMPEGDPKTAPEPRKFVEGWQLGTPDLILSTDEDFHLGASGPDTFRCFVLPTGLKEDKYIIGYEVRPGNPSIVHHTLNYWDGTGKARGLNDKSKANAKPTDNDRGPGYSVSMGLGFTPDLSDLEKMQKTGIPPFSGIGGWAPGQMPRFLPEGTGYYLPKDAEIVIQVHYHRNGRPEKDRTRIGLYFAKKPVEKPWRTLVIDGLPKITTTFPHFTTLIPKDRSDFVSKGSLWTETDCTVYSVLPHMHLLGKKVKVTFTTPDGKTETLVDIHDWDYNWQETYWFKEPISIKAGTRFDVEAIFDNSSTNPNNPNHPPKDVRSGDETTDEMLFGFIGATSANKDGRIKLSRTQPKK
jgi:mono/diheme cytochrome c family protein